MMVTSVRLQGISFTSGIPGAAGARALLVNSLLLDLEAGVGLGLTLT
jgi:hypothetical protein